MGKKNNEPETIRDYLQIRFTNEADLQTFREFEYLINNRILDHAASKRKTPRPTKNKFYVDALVRGMKADLYTNKTDDIADVAVKAVKKALKNNQDEITIRQNYMHQQLKMSMEYIMQVINYMVPFMQQMDGDRWAESIDYSTNSIKPEFLLPINELKTLFENIKSKNRNEIKSDTTIANLEAIVNGKEGT